MRLLLPMLAMLASPAGACAVAEEFLVTDVAFGPIVVAAEVTDYRVQKWRGRLTLDVTEVWKGAAPGHLTARWVTPGLSEPAPETWDDRPRRVIAALAHDGEGFDLVVETCGKAWLVADTPENRRDIRAALKP
ncbi:MAG: hypothetical protein ACT4OK_01950 [Gemmobacter sp.]